MSQQPNDKRNFLFLQGPHGPFFHQLGMLLRRAGCQVWRVGFNAGDQVFWRDRDSYVPYQSSADLWPETIAQLLKDKQVTDLVLYGDTRPIHAQAIAAAQAQNITVHVFEEGYMRPYWITYERGGSNGHSLLMDMPIGQMKSALSQSGATTPPPPPAHWGDTKQHVFYGALYHWFVMTRRRKYPNFTPHRSLDVREEFRLHLKNLLLMPLHAIERMLASRTIRRGGFPYHLTLLQLEHDASFQRHSPFSTMAEFLEIVIDGFAKGAAKHHHLVFKSHPLEDGRSPLRRDIRLLAKNAGIADRVHFVRGGKLAPLLDQAASAVTVNSTAGQQALWRGLPLRSFGKAVYNHPELTSDQPICAFFGSPKRPDGDAYKIYRRYLLKTSQVPGGFYSAKGRKQLLRHVADMMLAPQDPYKELEKDTATTQQQFAIVG